MNAKITLGSLFDGIGVFPLAAHEAGIVPLWASEIERWPISITKRRFPDMAHIGDITRIDGGKIPPVHVVTFGSPCQNLSSAGDRQGLAGAKSGLFFHAARVMKEMKEGTNGAYPAIAVWENVMGAFSSSDRMDFGAVLRALSGGDVPMPSSGRWAGAGMVRGPCADLAWRVMDARYWGSPPPPQRRRRIFLVADFGGERAGKILFRPCPLLADTAVGCAGGLQAASRNRIPLDEARRTLPTVRPIQSRKMRGCAKAGSQEGFRRSFGSPNDPFPTLLAGDVTAFALWRGNDHRSGAVRYLTPTECERLQGLPDGWTALGANGERIPDGARYKALGNAIALPCAAYVMQGIKETLEREQG